MVELNPAWPRNHPARQPGSTCCSARWSKSPSPSHKRYCTCLGTATDTLRGPVVCVGGWEGACCVEPLRPQPCTCRVGIRCVEPTVAPLWEQLALLVVPASCSGSCTEGANSQPSETELLASHGFQADVWPHCQYTRDRPPPARTGVRPAETPHGQCTSCSYVGGRTSDLYASQPDD